MSLVGNQHMLSSFFFGGETYAILYAIYLLKDFHSQLGFDWLQLVYFSKSDVLIGNNHYFILFIQMVLGGAIQ